MFFDFANAEYLSGNTLKVTFNNSECCMFDFFDVIARYALFVPLGEENRFKALLSPSNWRMAAYTLFFNMSTSMAMGNFIHDGTKIVLDFCFFLQLNEAEKK